MSNTTAISNPPMEIAATAITQLHQSQKSLLFLSQIPTKSIPHSSYHLRLQRRFQTPQATSNRSLPPTRLAHLQSFIKKLVNPERLPLSLKQNGSFGAALLGATATAKVQISPVLTTLASNPTFVSGLLAWFLAQSMKMCLNFFIERKWDLRIMCSSGGMPSSHSALCTALTTSVALSHGVADSLFPVSLGFSLIVMYDAIGVRRHAGMQAEVLNMIVEDLFKGHPISERKLKELLGHTPSQVLAGATLGILVGWFCCRLCL